MIRVLIPVFIGLGALNAAIAATQVATVTQLEGNVQILSKPGKTIQGPSPHALFEGNYYSAKTAALGDPIDKGNVVTTGVGAKVRVVYPNGDQINVGGGSSYRISWDLEKSGSNVAKTYLGLLYGKIRGIVEKGGPRSGLTVRAGGAVMGVRGTDFFISVKNDAAGLGGTDISVLRGEVAVKAAGSQTEPVAVKAGQSADIPSTAAGEAKPQAVALRTTSQEELKSIQKISTLDPERKQVSQSAAVAQKVAALEAKSIETTVKDIKISDPALYEQIKDKIAKNEFQSADQINAVSVDKLVKSAPKNPGELDNLDQDQYRKYFH